MPAIFNMTPGQAAVEDALRANAFEVECRRAGIDPVTAAKMDEAQLIRELEYRPLIIGNSAPIGPEAWRRLDTRASLIARDVLAVFSRLAAANTTPVSMGDIMSYFPQISDSGEVSVTMDGRNAGKSDAAVVKYSGTPVPIITAEARFGWRQMEVMRKAGTMLETETISNKLRKVLEKLEDMVLNGDTQVNVAGNTIYGLRNHPSRNTDTHGFDLNGAATTGANWVTAFTKLINALQGDNAFGRVTVFVNYSDWTFADLTDFKANGDSSIMQRLRSLDMIADIVPCSKVPADNILGIAGLETGEWGSILSGMAPTTRPKARQNAEDDYVYSVMAAQVPQFRTDFDGRAPFAHLTSV